MFTSVTTGMLNESQSFTKSSALYAPAVVMTSFWFPTTPTVSPLSLINAVTTSSAKSFLSSNTNSSSVISAITAFTSPAFVARSGMILFTSSSHTAQSPSSSLFDGRRPTIVLTAPRSSASVSYTASTFAVFSAT